MRRRREHFLGKLYWKNNDEFVKRDRRKRRRRKKVQRWIGETKEEPPESRSRASPTDYVNETIPMVYQREERTAHWQSPLFFSFVRQKIPNRNLLPLNRRGSNNRRSLANKSLASRWKKRDWQERNLYLARKGGKMETSQDISEKFGKVTFWLKTQ